MRINKHGSIFLASVTVLITSYFFVLVKFFPILIHHTFYYCQEMAKTIALSLPGNMGMFVFGALLITALYTAFKLLTTVLQVHKFRLHLSRSIVTVIDNDITDIFKTLKLENKVVILKEDKPYAYCFGIRNPKIFLTTGLISLVNKKELRVILRHEKYHLEHRDNLILLLATLVESLFPLFPIFTDLIRIYKIDRELLADQAAIQEKSDKSLLSSVLKKLLQYEPLTIPVLAPAIADPDTLETRIKSLLSIKNNYHRFGKRNFLYSLLFVAFLTILVGMPVNAVELHQNGVDAIIVCNENVSCESTCKVQGNIKLQSAMPSYTSKNFSPNK